jgi:transposase, IS30 family
VTPNSGGSCVNAFWRGGRRSRSPAGWLRRGEERGRGLRAVSCETVYAFIHRAGQKAEELRKLLPRGRARRGRRRAREPRATIAARRSIHDRPAEVQERKDAGHGEGDLLLCKRTRPVPVLKERETRPASSPPPGWPASRRPRPWRC